MRSRAHLKTHPLHPILVAFPIAFFTGTLVFDILAIMYRDNTFEGTAGYLLIAGIMTALVAAVPGFIDYLYTVPPKSSAKKRASTHGLLNVCMLALFGFSWFHRTTADDPSPTIYLILEGAGFAIMLIAGWLGGTLVHRNQIGVDHRYAFAGKWKELHPIATDGKVRLGNPKHLKRDQMQLIHVSGKRIVLAKTEDGYVAFDDRCTHKGGSLAGGSMICGTVQCPWHGSQFNVVNGSAKAGPASDAIAIYKTEIIDNVLYLILR